MGGKERPDAGHGVVVANLAKTRIERERGRARSVGIGRSRRLGSATQRDRDRSAAGHCRAVEREPERQRECHGDADGDPAWEPHGLPPALAAHSAPDGEAGPAERGVTAKIRATAEYWISGGSRVTPCRHRGERGEARGEGC